MASGAHPVLPADTGIYYLSEGAANIVYRISVPWPTPPPSVVEEYGDGTPPPSEIEDTDKTPPSHYLDVFDFKLLRVRKNLPTTAPCAVAHDAWQRLIAPIFKPAHIVDQILVELGPSKIIDRLNKELEGWEKYEYPMKGSLRDRLDYRPTKRQGIYLADDEYGLLITDMTPEGVPEGGPVTLYQFKPKWLVQSPSAPKDSKRCRQCARAARINAECARKGETSRQPTFCPLDLLSKAPRDIMRAAAEIMPPNSTEKDILRLAEWIQGSELLERLGNSQYLMDRKGVLEADPNDENFLACMTLRDCTLFLRLPDDEKERIEARIGDLDLKSPGKAEYWKSVEQPLIDEGWYLGLEPEEDWQPLTCHLSPERWGPKKGRRRNAG